MLVIIVIVSGFCMYSISKLKNTKTAFGDKELTFSEIISGFGKDENEEGKGEGIFGKDIFTKKNLFDAIEIADKQIGVAYFNIAVVATLAILFGGIMTIMFPKRVTKPILKLVDATVNVREGDYSYRVEDIKGTDEIAKLVTSFNRMLGSIEAEHNQLEERNAELEEKNELNKRLLEETENFNRILEEKIREVTSDLDSKNKELLRNEKLATIGEIATKIAHEIRNPLSGIAVALENIQSEVDHNKPNNRISEIIREVNRLDNIIRELFQLAIPREVSLVRGNPNELIDRVVSLISPQASEKNIKIEKNTTETEKEIGLDFELIAQVLMNLMINAVESIKEDKGKITISSDYSDNKFIITITDTGSGIVDGDKDIIFQPFYSNKKNGTGLGLAISKRIIEVHRGDISVERNEGSGSTFIVTLPTNLSEKELIIS